MEHLHGTEVQIFIGTTTITIIWAISKSCTLFLQYHLYLLPVHA
jgi:hypothetical protein